MALAVAALHVWYEGAPLPERVRGPVGAPRTGCCGLWPRPKGRRATSNSSCGARCSWPVSSGWWPSKQRPTQVYELRHLGPATPEEADAVGHFKAGVDAFSAREFEQAGRHFQAALRHWPEDGPTGRYLEEVAFLRLSPPGPDWDGASTGVVK